MDCIQFEIDGRRFEAFGEFLETGETSVTGYEMLARTDKDGNVVGEADLEFIRERFEKLPQELRHHDLVTKCKATEAENPHHVILLRWRDWPGTGAWNVGWLDLEARWLGGRSNRGSLRVLRRCT